MAHHVDTPEKLAKVVSLLIGFRTYMSYHIKATKSFIHARMRSRVEKLLQVLNRAVPEDPFASKAKKLISGKTFTRK
jgi:actin related protein 2/3 complex, subunit 2